MMEIVDELMTPGCPQCAVKHLSAALYHKAHLAADDDSRPDPYMVCVCTAYINLVEVRAGYHSHLWYAVGALVRAEEFMAARIGECVARQARLMLEEDGEEAVMDAIVLLLTSTAPTHADWATAHYAEAMRELPPMQAAMPMDDLIGSIEEIREEFFPKNDNLAEATVAPEENKPNKEGEPTMATVKKTPAKKGTTKCACKGGKTCTKAPKATKKGK